MKLTTFNTFLLNVFFPVSFFACMNTIFVITSAERSMYINKSIVFSWVRDQRFLQRALALTKVTKVSPARKEHFLARNYPTKNRASTLKFSEHLEHKPNSASTDKISRATHEPSHCFSKLNLVAMSTYRLQPRTFIFLRRV